MININLKKYGDIYNEYNNDKINKALDNYILFESKQLPLKNIELNIIGKFSENEKEKLIYIIHKYYQSKKNYLNKIDKYDHIFRLILFLVGGFILLLSYAFMNIFREIFLIAGWVIISETIYDLLFSNFKRERDKFIYAKLSRCKIEFQESKNEQ